MPSSTTAELTAILQGAAAAPETDSTIATRAHYAPPWADVSIIGIAGSSGSGKSTLSHAIVKKLNLPWVVILSIVSRSSSPDREGTVGPGLLMVCSWCLWLPVGLIL